MVSLSVCFVYSKCCLILVSVSWLLEMHSMLLILNYKKKSNLLSVLIFLCVAWVKLKLASRSEEAVLDLNEEDQQRIEEIKAELLLSAKRSGQAKVEGRQTSCSGEKCFKW